jgi:hypothetical protein
MKRIISLLAVTMMVLGVVACTNPPPSKQGSGNNQMEIPLLK